MFNSDVLDVGIGLVLVFLMMSIIMTAVQEALEGWLKSRATHLEDALKELLHAKDRPEALQGFYKHPLIYALYRGSDAVGPGKGPTYIPREAFSAALIDMVEKGDPSLPPSLQEAYAGLKRFAGQDANRLRREIEGWYDGAMDRASGWFRRRTQRNLFFMGLAAAIILNINALSIAQFLHANRAQRERIVKLADSTTAPAAAPAGASPVSLDKTKFQDELYDIGLPLGWNAVSRRWTLREFAVASRDDQGLPGAERALAYGMAGIGLVVGYLVTALATMLGAPFWFDILNRLMVIRSTVKPKEKSPDEPSQDGGTDKSADGPAKG